MALSQDDRISISKAFVAAPAEVAQIEQNKVQINVAKAEAQKKDDANKGLVDGVTAKIDPYQTELGLINGQARTQLTEQIIQDAGDRKVGNFFFPNEPSVPLPSVSDGIWKFFSPFFGGYGIGKQKLEVYGAVSPYETQLIADINAQITIIETYTGIQRVTGQKCTAGGVNPSPPPANLPDTIADDAILQAAMTTLISKVTQWQTNLNSQLTALTSVLAADSDATRAAAATAEQSSVNAMLTAIATWSAYPTFNTAHGETTCAGFNAKDPSTLAPTKGYSVQLNALKTAIATRSIAASARATAVSGYLGTVTQDPSTGDINGGSGLYLDRARALNLRLHTMGGSLSQLKGADKAIAALDQFKKNKQDALAVYASVMVVSQLRAPGNGTNMIHVKDASGLTAGSRVYVVTDSQPEIELFVQSVTGTMLTVDKQVPSSYRENEGGRIYKVL
jgi:hypothetical protein